MQNRGTHRSFLRPWVTLGLAVLLAGCAVGPDFRRPAVPTEQGLLPPGEPVSASMIALEAGAVSARWWTAFDNPSLDLLVDSSLHDSPTLQAAYATLSQADDALRAGSGIYFPSVGAGLDAARERNAPVAVGQALPSRVFNVFTASGTVNYLLDVFGGGRRQVEALRAARDAERYRVGGAFLILTGNVVNTAIARASYRAQVRTLQAMVQEACLSRALDQVQRQTGVGADSQVLTAEVTLSGYQASLAAMVLRAEQADHLQAELSGRLPSSAELVEIDLAALKLPASLPIALPSVLVRQRPDVLAAEAVLHEASAAVGVATANLFPHLVLSGSVGGAADRWPVLASTPERFWSAGADLSVPLFQGGTLWFGRQAALDAFRVAQHQYRQVVLVAFQQVADVLRAVSRDSDALAAADRALGDAHGLYSIAKANYAAGLVDGGALASAQIALGLAQMTRDSAYGVLLQDAVALFVALGGGWTPDASGIELTAPSSRVP